ncbi:ABC transporter permease [Rhizohabitans arisaemae]|uniref:ABC transporter permease n=1 Tax=Rhizohabitans arisaemae TaxID=2720610 RepID=UPI0024B1DB4E|nr:ABC transporter permease [Rhizohabitans arisaemae]
MPVEQGTPSAATTVTSPDPAPAGTPARRGAGRGLGPGALVALGWLAGLSVLALLGDALPFIGDPSRMTSLPYEPPSSAHPLGTDEIGRDVLSRVVYAARVSLPIAAGAVAVAMLVGGIIGLLTGFLRGTVDEVGQWLLDVLVSFPPLILAMAVTAFLGRSPVILAVILGLLFVPPAARLVRTHTMATSTREYVVAARVLGASRIRIVFREIVPAVVPHLLAYAVLAASAVIVIEGALSFLGLSIPPPTPTWGGMITAARDGLAEAPHVLLVPVAVLFATVLALNGLADTLRSRLVETR